MNFLVVGIFSLYEADAFASTVCCTSASVPGCGWIISDPPDPFSDSHDRDWCYPPGVIYEGACCDPVLPRPYLSWATSTTGSSSTCCRRIGGRQTYKAGTVGVCCEEGTGKQLLSEGVVGGYVDQCCAQASGRWLSGTTSSGGGCCRKIGEDMEGNTSEACCDPRVSNIWGTAARWTGSACCNWDLSEAYSGETCCAGTRYVASYDNDESSEKYKKWYECCESNTVYPRYGGNTGSLASVEFCCESGGPQYTKSYDEYYLLFTYDCCGAGEKPYNVDQVSHGWQYFPIQKCCAGEPYTKSKSFSYQQDCCADGGEVYTKNSNSEDCCSASEHVIDGKACCPNSDDEIYRKDNSSNSSDEYLCCDGGVYSKTSDEQDCCEEPKFTIDDKACCSNSDDEIYKKKADSNASDSSDEYLCCDGDVYSKTSDEQDCCPDGQHVVDDKACCPDATNEIYREDNSSNSSDEYLCCDGGVYTKSSDKQDCCPDGQYVIDGKACCPNLTDEIYQKSSSDSSDSSDEYECCNGTVYDKTSDSKDCCENPNEVSGTTCCEGSSAKDIDGNASEDCCSNAGGYWVQSSDSSDSSDSSAGSCCVGSKDLTTGNRSEACCTDAGGQWKNGICCATWGTKEGESCKATNTPD